LSKIILPVKHSVFEAYTLGNQVLRNYNGLGKIVNCDLLATGIHDVYRLKTTMAQYIIKVYACNKRKSEILEEAKLINHLSSKRFPTPALIKNSKEKQMYHTHAPEGIRYVLLFNYINGGQPIFDFSSSSQYGKLIAKLHAYTDHWKISSPKKTALDIECLIDKPLYHIRQALSSREKNKILTEITEACREIIQQLPITTPSYGICHGDIVSNGIMMRKNRLGILDFEWFGQGWRVYDISQFLWSIQHGTLPAHQNSLPSAVLLWESFLNAYKTHRVLSLQEEKAIPAFLIVRSLWMLGLQFAFSNTLGKLDATYNLENIWDIMCENRDMLLKNL